ncbi:MAG: ferritin [Bacteroidota bacterium]
MKDLLRRHHLLKDEVIDILNRQIKMEAQASAAYLAMANWCDVKGYDNSADFYFKGSDEERDHQIKLFHYVTDMECEAVSPTIDAVQSEFGTLREVFEKGLEMEIATSDAIHEVVQTCRKYNDIATEEYMRWFVMEQIEGEYIARRALELFDVLGEDKIALGMFEERVLKIEYTGANPAV